MVSYLHLRRRAQPHKWVPRQSARLTNTKLYHILFTTTVIFTYNENSLCSYDTNASDMRPIPMASGYPRAKHKLWRYKNIFRDIKITSKVINDVWKMRPCRWLPLKELSQKYLTSAVSYIWDLLNKHSHLATKVHIDM